LNATTSAVDIDQLKTTQYTKTLVCNNKVAAR
jgi:hypothetical protein